MNEGTEGGREKEIKGNIYGRREMDRGKEKEVMEIKNSESIKEKE